MSDVAAEVIDSEPRAIPDQLIINSPYEEPAQHWSYDRNTRTFARKQGRRPAGYVVASDAAQAFDDPGRFVEIELVNKIRPRIKAWRDAGYPGVTGITKRLLEHWIDPEERIGAGSRFFFCQIEAIETLIWWVEAPDADKVGIDLPSDGGAFQRLCTKLATGGGKTLVMAMVVAWQIINKVTYPQDARFSKSIFIVAPGLTVKNRLQVLLPSDADNYYESFNIVPTTLLDKLRQGRVIVTNWHALAWETEQRIAKRRSVDKRGAKSNEAYVRTVLGEMASNRNIVVINDEAHHAWRASPDDVKGVAKEEIEESTVWVGGLDRIHATRGVLRCFDFSATPFVPSGRKSTDEALFGWIVSDFGLNDAIESGLVKTPRVVVRDDGKLASDYKSRFYHIYRDDEVKDDINRKAEESEPLPDLVTNAYYFLGRDWLDTKERWSKAGVPVPPVMISVANNTFTAARITFSFNQHKVRIEELCDPSRTLHIDSKVLGMAEAEDEPVDIAAAVEVDDESDDSNEPKRNKKQQAEHLRKQVDTVGKVGEAGAQIQNVISVGMLSEGWDAKTVTHIMGLRAFSSQLLCEQVVGRGLRRTSYDVNPESGRFEPEYVNIFGVPFTFLPHEGGEDGPIVQPPPKVPVEPDPNKRQFEITYPNVIRIERVYRPTLTLDPAKVRTLEIRAYETPMIADLAPVIEGKPDMSRLSEIDLRDLAERFRMQRIIFETARDVFDVMQPAWKGSREYLIAQLIGIVEKVIDSGVIQIIPPLFAADEMNRRVLITLNLNKLVHHIWEAIGHSDTVVLEPQFDRDHPIRSTGDMRTWYTGRPNEITKKSHINRVVFDSTWEASEAFELDRNPNVEAWVKNDHLNFEIMYIWRGVVKKYRPDYIVRLTDGSHLVLEVKGQETEQDRSKRAALDEWIEAVNQKGGFGRWRAAVSYDPADLPAILDESNV